jgi:FPC/CPF motif-containing protein YcgG
MSVRGAVLRTTSVIGAVIGYGCLAAFLYLISLQLYRWFRQGEWTHVGTGDGLRISLVRCCLKEDGSGRIAGFVQWWDSPVSWLGLHKVFEVVPASLALFAVSIAGNSLFIFCRDRLQARRAAKA